MQIIVTIMRATGYIGGNKVPVRDMSTVREVCFYKLDTPPTAKVKFNTCGPKCKLSWCSLLLEGLCLLHVDYCLFHSLRNPTTINLEHMQSQCR